MPKERWDKATVADKSKYGKFCAGPGTAGYPEIIHGSTANKEGKADSHRLVVVNPWLLGIQEDHETMGIPEWGTWTTVAVTSSRLNPHHA